MPENFHPSISGKETQGLGSESSRFEAKSERLVRTLAMIMELDGLIRLCDD
jgi:hypothetical protein